MILIRFLKDHSGYCVVSVEAKSSQKAITEKQVRHAWTRATERWLMTEEDVYRSTRAQCQLGKF